MSRPSRGVTDPAIFPCKPNVTWALPGGDLLSLIEATEVGRLLSETCQFQSSLSVKSKEMGRNGYVEPPEAAEVEGDAVFDALRLASRLAIWLWSDDEGVEFALAFGLSVSDMDTSAEVEDCPQPAKIRGTTNDNQRIHNQRAVSSSAS